MLKSNSIKFVSASLLILTAFAGTAQAGPKEKAGAKVAAAVPDNDKVPVLTDAEYEKLIQSAKLEVKRKPAQTDRVDYATAIPDDFKNLTADLQGGKYWENGKETAKSAPPLKTGADFARVIEKYEGTFKDYFAANPKTSPQTQMVAAQLIALKPYRGILYRLRPLAEAQHTPGVHASILAFLRALNANVNNLYPSEQWKAGFAYIAEPYPNMGEKIKTEDELNAFIAHQILPTQVMLTHRFFRIPLEEPVYIDNKIFWDKANFASDKDRFQLVWKPEKYAYLSTVAGNVSSLYSSLAYDWSDLFKATNHYWKEFMFKTMFNRPENMTAEERVAEIKSNKKLFTLLKGGEALTTKSYDWFIHSLRFARTSWKFVQALDAKGEAKTPTFMDPQAIMPFARPINTTFANIEEIIGGKGIGSAVVNGESVDVNFKALFTNPPADMKAFLPTAFEGDEKELTEPVTGLKYRNYTRGNPKGWNIAAYAPYFPGVKSNDDVKRTARILSQSWGGGLLGFPLASVLY